MEKGELGLPWQSSELPDVQAGLRKGRGTRDQIANIHWIIEKSREFQKNIYFCLIDYAKTFDCVQQTVENSSRDGNTKPSDLPLDKYVCRSGSNSFYWTWNTDWFQIRKGVCQECILSPCLFNLYAEYIMRNCGLDEAQTGLRLPGEISITSDTQMTPYLWQKVKN